VIRAALMLALLGAQDAGGELRFVTCPVYRDADSGRKSGCWLAEDRATGLRYDVSLAPSKPDWNHPVLVEGRLSNDSIQPCGSPVLDAVRTSILPGDCARHMLPAEGYPGRRYVLPRRNVRPLSEARQVAPGPYAPRTFHLLFDYDQTFLIYQYDDYLLDEAITWIRAVKPRAIAVTGYAATAPAMVSGVRIAEQPGIARERAEKIAEALVRLGVERRILTVRWKTGAAVADIPEADGLAEPSRRRVDIAVIP
jgi:hypothetical protein